MENTAIGIGDRIRQVRKARKIPLQKLGKLVGLSAASLSQYELGRVEPSIDMIEKIAKALDTPAYYLAFGALNPDSYQKITSDRMESLLTLYFALSSENGSEAVLQLMREFYNLNPEGREKALEAVKVLSEVPRFHRVNAGLPIDLLQAIVGTAVFKKPADENLAALIRETMRLVTISPPSSDE